MRARATAGASSGVRGWVCGVVLATACHPASGPTPPASTDTGGATEAEGTTTPEDTAAPELTPLEPAPCGAEGERFDDHAWAPSSATTVASVELDAPELRSALAALAEHARTPGHGLPIPLSFSLGEWSWQRNPFVATTQYNGLLATLMLFGSSDL